MNSIPNYAVVGHPNQGKSSVISALTENDGIPIDHKAGTTRHTQAYSILIHGEERVRFWDTPGFEYPKRVLEWFRAYAESNSEQVSDPESHIVQAFIREHKTVRELQHDVRLLTPLADDAGVVYVVDGSQPIREDDRREMEILRLSGLPRMALVNHRNPERDFLASWKQELNRHFNLVRVFNAHEASFSNRRRLLQGLRELDPDWARALDEVVTALDRDWSERLDQAIHLLDDALSGAVTHRASLVLEPENRVAAREKLLEKYQSDLRGLEKQLQSSLHELFRHHRLAGAPDFLPPLVQDDLFSKEVWTALGLTRSQLVQAGATGGALLGAGVDVAAAGLSFGVFTAGGAIAGGIGALFGGTRQNSRGRKSMLKRAVDSITGARLQLGPRKDPEFVFVVLDRALLYVVALANWSHARQDSDAFLNQRLEGQGLVANWDEADRKSVQRWQASLISARSGNLESAREEFHRVVKKELSKLLDR